MNTLKQVNLSNFSPLRGIILRIALPKSQRFRHYGKERVLSKTLHLKHISKVSQELDFSCLFQWYLFKGYQQYIIFYSYVQL